jgi:NitT/TauT family transport system substrate-binding protein
MNTRLTTFSKILITALILGVIFFAFRYFLTNTEYGKNLKQTSEQQATKPGGGIFKSSAKDDDVIKVQMFTWGGYVPGLYFNEGAAASTESRFYKEYGIKVEFKLIDDFDASRNAWKSGDVNLLGNEVSAMATEMTGLGQYQPQIVLQCDWSRGGDAIVAKRGINSFNDLKGKVVAVTPSTPSMTFLLWMLEAANLKISDLKQIKEVPSAIDAATAFKSGQVDAAVVWSPDDEVIVREVPGSKILQSTRQASNIIADVYMAKKSYVEKNADKLAKFYEGWMKAVAEINTSTAARQKAAKLLAQVTGISDQDAAASINNVRLTTHGDNLNFFGKNPAYKGITGEALYTKMGNIYQNLKQAPADRPNWRLMAYGAAMGAADLPKGPGYDAEGQKVFATPTAADQTTPEMSTKAASITFASGKFELDENSKTIIDLQFADVAKAFSNARVRIEGNTDNVGNPALNKKLSLQRAESVAKYLQTQYNMSRNRFVIVGNGSGSPVLGCESNATPECKAKNRRTEFKLIN